MRRLRDIPEEEIFELVERLDVRGPRYTSYPTVPVWLFSRLPSMEKIHHLLTTAIYAGWGLITVSLLFMMTWMFRLKSKGEVLHAHLAGMRALWAAVDIANRVFGKLDRRKILLVGAGETTRLAAKYLAEFGGNSWRVSNRTQANAEDFAASLGGSAVAFPPSEADIAWADLIVSATSSPEPVIREEAANGALHLRKDPMLILDLAVPRDVDARIRDFDNVYLYGIDDFHDIVRANLKAREREAVRAEKLIAKQVEEFVTWYRENRVAPTIRQLKEVLEAIRMAEVRNNARRFTPENREQVDEFSKSLMRKVTSLIIGNMKRASLDRDDLSLAKAVSMAFAPSDDTDVDQILEKLDYELSH
jgi:glutamyl-tRNA reductase